MAIDMTFFGMTKTELQELVAGTDEQLSIGAKNELDRRAAKKAAKRDSEVTIISRDPYYRLRQAIDDAFQIDSSNVEMETILDCLKTLFEAEDEADEESIEEV